MHISLLFIMINVAIISHKLCNLCVGPSWIHEWKSFVMHSFECQFSVTWWCFDQMQTFDIGFRWSHEFKSNEVSLMPMAKDILLQCSMFHFLFYFSNKCYKHIIRYVWWNADQSSALFFFSSFHRTYRMNYNLLDRLQ